MAREAPAMINVKNSLVLILPERVALEAAKARKGTLHNSILHVVKDIEVSSGNPASVQEWQDFQSKETIPQLYRLL